MICIIINYIRTSFCVVNILYPLFFSLPPSLHDILQYIYIYIHTLVCSRCCYQCRILCQKILYTVRVPSNLLLLLLLSGLAGWCPFICAKGIAVRAFFLPLLTPPTVHYVIYNKLTQYTVCCSCVSWTVPSGFTRA